MQAAERWQPSPLYPRKRVLAKPSHFQSAPENRLVAERCIWSVRAKKNLSYEISRQQRRLANPNAVASLGGKLSKCGILASRGADPGDQRLSRELGDLREEPPARVGGLRYELQVSRLAHGGRVWVAAETMTQQTVLCLPIFSAALAVSAACRGGRAPSGN